MTDPTLSRLAAIPDAEHAASVHIRVHARTHDTYRALRDAHDGTEESVPDGDRWHRWAIFYGDGSRYVIHDPDHYDTDPLGIDKRLAELRDMIVTVLDASDMTGPDKVREITRLTGRMGALVDGGATYSDGTTDDTTRAFDAFADAAAAPGGPE